MDLAIQKKVVELVVAALGAELGSTPPWLMRPGEHECGQRWELVKSIYGNLTGGQVLPDLMPPRERRVLDAVLTVGGQSRALEVDETQHFNEFRATSLARYAHDSSIPLAFPAEL
jgi:hypothetical protein